MEATIGKRITANRKRLGLTQDQLAEKLGITAQAVSKWENDLSCPDISILPKLADIFETTIDELLGREAPEPVCKTTVVEDNHDDGYSYSNENTGFSYNSETGKMDLHWGGNKINGIGLACWVILTGILYFVAQIIPVTVSFWNILWPSFLFVFGIFGLFPKFSVFRLGCSIVGAYFLLDKMQVFSFTVNSSIILAVVIVFFGLSLLTKAIGKSRQRHVRQIDVPHGKLKNDYTIEEDRFSYDASFGTCTQIVQLEKLRYGSISTSFGEFTVDLTGVEAFEEPCTLNADCSFGELTLLIPRTYTVIPNNSTSFASVVLTGQPASPTLGTIHLHADASFGEIHITYI